MIVIDAQPGFYPPDLPDADRAAAAQALDRAAWLVALARQPRRPGRGHRGGAGAQRADRPAPGRRPRARQADVRPGGHARDPRRRDAADGRARGLRDRRLRLPVRGRTARARQAGDRRRGRDVLPRRDARARPRPPARRRRAAHARQGAGLRVGADGRGRRRRCRAPPRSGCDRRCCLHLQRRAERGDACRDSRQPRGVAMPLRRAGAEFVGTFVLVSRRCRRGGDRRRADRQPRRRVRVRALAAGDGLRGRADLRLPHQPGGHARAARHQADRDQRGGPLLDRAGARRDRRRGRAADHRQVARPAATTPASSGSAPTATATTRRAATGSAARSWPRRSSPPS